MAIYICYMLLAGIQVPFFYRRKRDELGSRFDAKRYLGLCCIELILLAGVRGYTVGADTSTYLGAVEYYSRFSLPDLLRAKLVWPYSFEIGYFWLTKLNIMFGLGKTGFLFLVAIITYIPIFATIKKYSSRPYISILCYFAFEIFAYSLGIFRQMLAISILLCGCKYIIERRFVKYMLVVGIAMLFHTTAVIAIVLYVLYGVKWKRVIWLLPVAEIGLLALGRPVVMLAMKLLPKYESYIGGKYDIQDQSYTMLLMWNAILFICILFEKKGDDIGRLANSALILTACLQCVSYSVGIFGRIVPYFSIYIILAIPSTLNSINKKWRILAVPIAVACLFILAFIDLYGNKYVTPYYTIFSGLPN